MKLLSPLSKNNDQNILNEIKQNNINQGVHYELYFKLQTVPH